MTKKMKFFIGPCVLEGHQFALDIAEQLKEDLTPFKDKIELYFKGSFDKANRTSIDSYRGPGMEEGLKILADINQKTGLPTITDFHAPGQAAAVASVVSVLQIPAFLCRQTDMILAGAEAAKKFNRYLKIKKGQFLAPGDSKNIVDKAEKYLPKDKILLTERGVSFGYNNLIVDMSSFQIMKSFGVETIYDATHSVQMPSGAGKTSGGKREFIRVLSRAAVAAGADGVFMEAHPNPDKALSDASTSLHLDQIKDIVAELLRIKGALS